MKELVVLSGKGGTGKTSIVASFAYLANNIVLADCDVDAPDLHLVVNPINNQADEFFSGKFAQINSDKCLKCGKCYTLCKFSAIEKIEKIFTINHINCEGCGVCSWFCPNKAIILKTKKTGQIIFSNTPFGALIHAQLNIAEENSGKLVAKVRSEARNIAQSNESKLIIIDGSPGIGCPVIASLTGASLVLIITEPTVSGIHDMNRVIELANHFNIKVQVCINKYDLNIDKTKIIENYCNKKEIPIVGKIKYDTNFTKSQINKISLIEYCNNDSTIEIKNMWKKIKNYLYK